MHKAVAMRIDLEKSIYYPGEILVGSLHYQISERLRIKKIKICIDGSAKVQW